MFPFYFILFLSFSFSRIPSIWPLLQSNNYATVFNTHLLYCVCFFVHMFVCVCHQLNVQMASIGKAFSWITRTLLGTESPANLDQHRCHSHSNNSKSLASKIDDNLGPFFLFQYFVSFFSRIKSEFFFQTKCFSLRFFFVFHLDFRTAT